MYETNYLIRDTCTSFIKTAHHITKKYSRVLFLVRYTYPHYLSFDYIVINSTLILVSDTWALRCKVWVPLNLDSKVTSNMTTSVYGDDYERIRRRL